MNAMCHFRVGCLNQVRRASFQNEHRAPSLQRQDLLRLSATARSDSVRADADHDATLAPSPGRRFLPVAAVASSGTEARA
jgi:hypothetical protein